MKFSLILAGLYILEIIKINDESVFVKIYV